MSIETLDQKLNAIADWYADSLRKLHAEMGARIESVMTDSEGVPPHLVKASVNHMLKRMEDASKALMEDV